MVYPANIKNTHIYIKYNIEVSPQNNEAAKKWSRETVKVHKHVVTEWWNHETENLQNNEVADREDQRRHKWLTMIYWGITGHTKLTQDKQKK